MIVGNPNIFAIESHIETAYANPGFRALGFFVIHVNGKSYGVRNVGATMLACSYDSVQKRIVEEGTHIAPFESVGAAELSSSIIHALYAEADHNRNYWGLSSDEFSNVLHSSQIIWAPDGDEAFDDRSFVLQFDSGSLVRLVAFRRCDECSIDPETLTDLQIPKAEFYRILQDWYEAFTLEWERRISEESTH